LEVFDSVGTRINRFIAQLISLFSQHENSFHNMNNTATRTILTLQHAQFFFYFSFHNMNNTATRTILTLQHALFFFYFSFHNMNNTVTRTIFTTK